MTPLFGVTAGIVVLHERAEASFALGAVLVLVGILIVSAPGLLRPAARSEVQASSPEPSNVPQRG